MTWLDLQRVFHYWSMLVFLKKNLLKVEAQCDFTIYLTEDFCSLTIQTNEAKTAYWASKMFCLYSPGFWDNQWDKV